MYTQGIKRVQFEETDAGSDWQFPYRLIVPAMVGWDETRDLVVLAMTPDYSWRDDYGFRGKAAWPAYPDFWCAPFYQATSDDSDGTVTLIDPNLINIIVPWNVMRRMGPGGVTVGVQYRAKDTERRTLLLTGRLPVIGGGV